MKKLLAKIRAWLTISRRCAWHPTEDGKVMHRAPLRRQWTDGICQGCLRREKRNFKLSQVRPLHPELTEPETPFTLSR